MAVPTQYSEAELAAYMVGQLGEIASVLGWVGIAQVQEAVNETELAYGATVSLASDMVKIRALARREAWRLAVASLAARTDFSNPEGDYKRSQMFAAAKERLAAAEAECGPYDTRYAAVVSEVSRRDPYGQDWRSEWEAE